MKQKFPQSVSQYIYDLNPELWIIKKEKIEWNELDMSKSGLISGAAFIDMKDPFGKKRKPL